jgi:putative transposase
MARPLRIEFPGAVYHVTSRGDRRELIFEDDRDRDGFLGVLGQAMARHEAQILAYCLMGNHYHLVLHTRRANLSVLMRHVNGVYTQTYNRRHGKVGHLFQGRFKAILVDRDAYLLELCRYVELNPVRAGMVQHPGAWAWSSYLAHTAQVESPEWLDTAGLHGYLLGHSAANNKDRRQAVSRYETLVAAGVGVPLWETGLRQQIYLGNEAFVTRMQALAAPSRAGAAEIPKIQRQKAPATPRSLAQWLKVSQNRDEAIWQACTVSGLSMTQIAQEAGLSLSRVSRVIASQERIRVSLGQ